MKVIAGLGNPGRKYESTRHNVGFEVLASLSQIYAGGRPKLKFEAELVELEIRGERAILAAPQTYMNASGRSIRQILEFYRIPLSDLLVICDDINLPLGSIRLRRAGSSGGQKGLENTIQQLGTQEFSRLRVGVDAPPAGMETADFVLGRFSRREAESVAETLALATRAAEAWVELGIDAAMNQFNRNEKQ